MTPEDFIKNYCNPPKNCPNSHQITWDLVSDIEDRLNDDDLDYKTSIESSLYDVQLLLEVVDKSLPDYLFLCNLEKALLSLEK